MGDMGTDPLPPEPVGLLPEDPLTRGREALATGAWLSARAAFEELLAVRETPEALEGLGAASWWLADVTLTFAARERAFRLYRDRNDVSGAARMALALAGDYFSFKGDYTIARGWRQRAHRLLEGRHPTPEAGWLALVEAQTALEVDHAPATAQTWSAQAASLGRALGSHDMEMLALAYEGLALVHQGRVGEGLRRLDEAGMAAITGEMTGIDAACSACRCFIYACERMRDLEQAAHWCATLKELSARGSHHLAFALCRTQLARLLIWQGEWPAAEAELQEALRALQSTYTTYAAEALLLLAELRGRQGRFEEAEALLAQAETGPARMLAGDLVLLARANLALEQDAPDRAAVLAERFLRSLPPEDRLRQVAALELLVKAQVANNEVSRASGGLVELSAITAGLSSRPMQASARFAAGLVFAAQNNRDSALACFADAVEWWTRSGTPFEAARARLQLARGLASLGRHLEASEEARSALTVLRSMGATREAERATALLRRLEGPPSVRDGGGPGLTKRELQVLRLIARGLSNKEIALQLIVSEHTVHRHVANIFDKLNLPSRAAAAAYAAQHYWL